MAETKIEWTERTWNPIVGCTIHSPGCKNCYAMRMAARLEAMAVKPDGNGNPALNHYVGTTESSRRGAVWTGNIGIAPDDSFTAPLRRKKPTDYFVNSMSDLFHVSVPFEVIDRVFAVMALTPQHTYKILTKRSDRMREYMNGLWQPRLFPHLERWQVRPAGYGVMLETKNGVLPNVWLGVSVEDQTRADERIPDLLATPAAVRFISAEPLLGPVDIGPWIPTCYECGASCGLRLAAPPKVERCTECGEECGPETEPVFSEGCPKCSGELEFVCPDCSHAMVYQHPDTPNIDWVIAGGESGPDARPMHPAWARCLRDQCAAAGVPFFFKQNGEYASVSEVEGAGEHYQFPDGATVRKVGKKRAGRLLDGVEHNGFPGQVEGEGRK